MNQLQEIKSHLAEIERRLQESERVLEIVNEALKDASSHLDYCGYGDKWERECAREQKLEQTIEAALTLATTHLNKP